MINQPLNPRPAISWWRGTLQERLGWPVIVCDPQFVNLLVKPLSRWIYDNDLSWAHKKQPKRRSFLAWTYGGGWWFYAWTFHIHLFPGEIFWEKNPFLWVPCFHKWPCGDSVIGLRMSSLWLNHNHKIWMYPQGCCWKVTQLVLKPCLTKTYFLENWHGLDLKNDAFGREISSEENWEVFSWLMINTPSLNWWLNFLTCTTNYWSITKIKVLHPPH